MYIKIHRGTGQIGGNIIEVGTKQTRLIFDAGSNLPPLDDRKYSDPVEIQGLTYGDAAFDAVFISHRENLDGSNERLPLFIKNSEKVKQRERFP